MVMVATAIGLALLLAYPFLAGAEDTALTLGDGCNGGACDPNNPDSLDGTSENDGETEGEDGDGSSGEG